MRLLLECLVCIITHSAIGGKETGRPTQQRGNFIFRLPCKGTYRSKKRENPGFFSFGTSSGLYLALSVSTVPKFHPE